jgi:hypothetical protein
MNGIMGRWKVLIRRRVRGCMGRNRWVFGEGVMPVDLLLLIIVI